MLTALAILEAFNRAAPGVAELILLIRRKNGKIAIMPMLDEAAAQFDENIATANEWLAAHPAKPPTV